MFKCVLLLAVQWIRNWFEFQDNFHDGAETHHDQPWGKAQRLWDWRDDQVIIWLIIEIMIWQSDNLIWSLQARWYRRGRLGELQWMGHHDDIDLNLSSLSTKKSSRGPRISSSWIFILIQIPFWMPNAVFIAKAILN